jgi:hypothetical protein
MPVSLDSYRSIVKPFRVIQHRHRTIGEGSVDWSDGYFSVAWWTRIIATRPVTMENRRISLPG